MKIPNILKINRKKIIIVAAIILTAVLIFVFFGQKKQAPLQFAEVKKQDIRSAVSASGTLTGKSTVNLKFKSSGKLAYLNVKVGDTVKTGQTIAGLDTQDLAIALQQARNTLTDKQATVDKIHDDVKDHDKDESFTQRQTRTTAEAAANNAYDAVKASQRAFQDAVISSPVNGIITQAISASPQTVSAADIIAQVIDTTEIYFDADIDEADLYGVAVNLPAEVTLDAYPDQVFKGVVDQIIPATKTTSQGATVITVRIKLDSPDLTFVNNLTGEAQIISKEAKNVLTVSQEALTEDNNVVIQDNGILKPQKVTPGIKSDTDIEIKEGLRQGQKILLNPPAAK